MRPTIAGSGLHPATQPQKMLMSSVFRLQATEMRHDFRPWLQWRKHDAARLGQEREAAAVPRPDSDPSKFEIGADGKLELKAPPQPLNEG